MRLLNLCDNSFIHFVFGLIDVWIVVIPLGSQCCSPSYSSHDWWVRTFNGIDMYYGSGFCIVIYYFRNGFNVIPVFRRLIITMKPCKNYC